MPLSFDSFRIAAISDLTCNDCHNIIDAVVAEALMGGHVLHRKCLGRDVSIGMQRGIVNV